MSEQPPREPHEPHDPAEDETVVVPPDEAPLEETVVADSWGPEEEVFVEQREEAVPAAPPRRRPPLLWPGLLALLLLVLGGILAFVLISGDDDETATPTTTARSVSVPEVVGSPEGEATAALRAAGFEVTVARVPSEEQQGIVVAQDPAGGVEADEGSTVRINVAEQPEQTAPAETEAPPATTAPPPATTEPPPTTTEPPPPTTTEPPPQPEPATVPDVVDRELAEAARAFGDEGLKIAVRYVPSDAPLGTVVAQAQDPGTELERGGTVQVNVSPGAEPPPNATVPDASGRQERAARNELERAGFEVLAIELEEGERGFVASQTPPGGAAVPRGSLVILYLGA